jgi:branched-chain amino acid transport system permease protein
MLAQSILNGLMSGWIYILVGLGLTVVMSITGIVQLAHGEIYMLGAYAMYYIFVAAGINFFVSVALSGILTGLIGVFLERFLFRPFRGNLPRALIISLGLVLVLQALASVSFGAEQKAIYSPFSEILEVFRTTISLERLIVIITSIALVTALVIFIQRSKWGQAMVAISQNLDLAALMGINVNRVSAIAMGLGCALAGIAGAFVGTMFSLSPTMGSFAIMKGIAVIIMGGLGSIPGAVIGGLILGMIDGVVPNFLTIHMANIIGFVLIIAFLILRPRGIMGHE